MIKHALSHYHPHACVSVLIFLLIYLSIRFFPLCEMCIVLNVYIFLHFFVFFLHIYDLITERINPGVLYGCFAQTVCLRLTAQILFLNLWLCSEFANVHFYHMCLDTGTCGGLCRDKGVIILRGFSLL